MLTRRQFSASLPWLTAVPVALSGCTPTPAGDSYEAVAGRTWQMGSVSGFSGVALSQELVRYPTLAPSSHNTQCWMFALNDNGRSITILPDLARRCPVVDPDEHHIFVTLGCATENMIQAALAHGLKGQRPDLVVRFGRGALLPRSLRRPIESVLV